MKKIVSLLLIIIMLFALPACGESNLVSDDDGGNTVVSAPFKEIDMIVVGTASKIVTANRSEYNFSVISGTLSQLAPIWVDEVGEYHPLLCDYSTEDSKTWTFTVREGMTWHDGTPVTAEDIRFTLEYLDTQEKGGNYAGSYIDIRVKDERTIELELENANPRQLRNLVTLRIMPKHIYEGITDYATVANEQANIGCGPYKFVRFDADAGVVEFAAYEAYPDGIPVAKTVMLKLFDNADTMYMALKAGDVDMVYSYAGGVATSVIEDLSAAKGIALMPVKDTSNTATFIFNNNMAPGNDENVRKAVAAAIDYTKCRELFGSSYSVASAAGFIPPGTYGYVETPVLERDLTAAKDYLSVSGYTDTDGDGYVDKDGQKLSITVTLRSDKPEHARYAELLRNNLKDVGIDLILDVQETAVFREITERQRTQQAVITKLTAYGMGMNQGLASLYIWGENRMSYGQVYDEDYKALLDKADAASMDEYKTVAVEIQQYYADHMPAIALFWDSYVQAYSDRLEGFVVDGTFGYMNVQSWMNLIEK